MLGTQLKLITYLPIVSGVRRKLSNCSSFVTIPLSNIVSEFMPDNIILFAISLPRPRILISRAFAAFTLQQEKINWTPIYSSRTSSYFFWDSIPHSSICFSYDSFSAEDEYFTFIFVILQWNLEKFRFSNH